MAHVLINSAMGVKQSLHTSAICPGIRPEATPEIFWPRLGLQRSRIQCGLKGAPADWFLPDLELHRLGR
jgi:hypothetical protein